MHISGAALALYLAVVSHACAIDYYVSGQDGDDAKDCIAAPCASIQAAINRSSLPGDTIHVADWDQEYAMASVTYHRSIAIVGNCADPARVRVAGLVGANHPVLQIGCLSTPWVLGRQMSIFNLLQVHFLANPGGNHVSAQVNSVINYKGGIVIEGSASNHAVAGYNSYIPMTGDITIPKAVSFDCFAKAQRHSDIDFGEGPQTGFRGDGAVNSSGSLACADETSMIGVSVSLNRGGFR